MFLSGGKALVVDPSEQTTVTKGPTSASGTGCEAPTVRERKKHFSYRTNIGTRSPFTADHIFKRPILFSRHVFGTRRVFLARDIHGKNGFVTATKLGTTDKIFVAATKNFATATKSFVDRTRHFVVVTICFCYPYFNK